MSRKRNSASVTGSPAAQEAPLQPTDAELVERIRRSDEAAFNLLYERYFDRVFGFTLLRLHNRADAEEVVQETFTAVFRSIEGFRGRSTLASWIFGVAKNNVNNHIRRAKSQEQRIERVEAELTYSNAHIDCCTPEDELSLSRCEDAIEERLASVEDWHREAFVLRHFQDLSIGEISRRVARSNDAVRSSLYRMKKMLVEAVESGVPVPGQAA